MSDTSTKTPTRNDIERLLDDAGYLVDELESLKHVIFDVEYQAAPPGSEQLSILDMLQFIQFAQENYYSPLVKQLIDEEKSSTEISWATIQRDFKGDSNTTDEMEVETVLNGIIDGRKTLLDRIQSVPGSYWFKKIERPDFGKLSLHELLNEMVRFEREQLKDIAERVQVMSFDREQQRQINTHES